MKPKSTFRPFLLAAGSSLLAISSASAANIWDGEAGTGFWNTGTNWDNNNVPAANAVLTFTGNVQNSTNNNTTADRQYNGFLFTNDGTAGKTNAFTLAGSRITLGGNIVTTASSSALTDLISLDMILNGDRTITTNTNHNLTISGIISESGTRSLIKDGAGTLTLSNTNTYSGGTTISAGILNAGTAGALHTGAVVNNATLNLTSTAGTTYAFGAVSGNGTINISLGSGSTEAIFNNPSWASFTGIINIGVSQAAGSGKVRLTNKALPGTATVNITSNSSLYTGFTGGVTHNAALTLGGGDTGESFGQLRFGNNGGVWAGAITLAGSVTGSGDVTVGVDGGTATISGAIGESGGSQSFSKGGGGTLVLSNANTFTGATTIKAGTLTLGNALALQNSTLDTSGSVAGTNSAGLKTTVTTVTLGGLSGNKNLASVFTTTSGGYSSVTALTLNPGAGATPSYSGNIANGANGMTLTKTGAGTQTLSGANSYTGGTFVNNGILLVNNTTGSGTGTGAVTVNDGGTLGGTGSIGGALTVKSGGTHAPGNSPGIQSISGNTTYESGSIFAWDLNSNAIGTRGTNYDGVTVTGNLTVQSGAIFRVIQNLGLDFADPFWDSNQSWSGIFSVSNTLTGWATDTLVAVYDTNNTLQNVSSQGYFKISNSTLTWTAVPEPSTALAGLLLAAGLLRRRRAPRGTQEPLSQANETSCRVAL